MTPESICNQALDLVGHKGRRIGSLYDGLPASQVALECYAEVRDELLNADQPYWAQRRVQLVLLATAPDNYSIVGWTLPVPPIDYKYEYSYPIDCITPLYVQTAPLFRPIWRPKYSAFDVYSRITSGTESKTIVTNASNAILTYTAQVLNPSLWQEDFTAKMIAALAQRFQVKLGAPNERQSNNSSGPRQQSAG